MAERLTFNYGLSAPKRDLPSRIQWVTSPETGTLPEAVSPYLPAIERPDWAYWGVFAFTALLFFRPQDTFPVLGPLHLPELAAIAALIAMFGHRLTRHLPLIKLTPELRGVAALALVMLLTIPFSIWPGGAFRTFTDLYLKVVLVFVLMVNSIKAPKSLKHFTWLIVVAMGYVAARGVYDYSRGVHLIQGDRLAGAISGLMGNPNDLATNMVTFLPLAIFIAIMPGRRLPRLFATIVVFLMLATIVFTKSRGGMLGLVATGVVVLVQAHKIRPGVVIAALIGVLAVAPALPSAFWTRVSSIVYAEEDETGSRQARKELMIEGVQTFLERPITGVGAGQFKNYQPTTRDEPWRETHNVLLQVAAELGIFGLAIFLYLVSRSFTALRWTKRMFLTPHPRARRSQQSDGEVSVLEAFRPEERQWMRMHVAAMTSGFVGWFVCAQFASIGYYWTFYYLLALIVAAREVTVQRIEAAQLVADRARAAQKAQATP